jgi:hypothetical protein
MSTSVDTSLNQIYVHILSAQRLYDGNSPVSSDEELFYVN